MSNKRKAKPKDNGDELKTVHKLTVVYRSDGAVGVKNIHPDFDVNMVMLTSAIGSVAKQFMRAVADGKAQRTQMEGRIIPANPQIIVPGGKL
jgi:hypothetical protein